MPLAIHCECGAVVSAGSEEALLAAARAHLQQAHAAAAGAVTSSDLLAMARPPGAGASACHGRGAGRARAPHAPRAQPQWPTHGLVPTTWRLPPRQM